MLDPGRSYARDVGYDPTPLELVYGTTPAAAANFALGMPPREGWLLVAVFFRFTADANAADRAVTVDYEDGNGAIFVSNGVGFVVQANTAESFSFSSNIGQAAWNTGAQAFVPLLPVVFRRGQSLQINVTNKQAGDQIDRIRLTFERQVYAPS